MVKCRKNEVYISWLNRCAPVNKPFIEEIVIRHIEDSTPDLDWLKTEYDEDNHEIIKSMRYSNKDVKKYGWDKVKEWIDGDHERLEDYGMDWEMMGITAEAHLLIPQKTHPISFKSQVIESGGLWGIETDSGQKYLTEIESEQLGDLIRELKMLNISESEIKKAKIKIKKFDSEPEILEM